MKKIYMPKDRPQAEFFLRKLWRESFGDSASYEEFYFTNVYRNNIVYEIEGKGMLHLNPYFCQIQGTRMMLFYIVGVATVREERRKGVMNTLLRQALIDLYKEELPFTYLMPADVKYYEPYSFISISEKREKKLSEKSIVSYMAEMDICFVSYEEMVQSCSKDYQKEIFQFIQNILEQKYSVFAVHDEAYFELLYQEKRCQGGNVIFCFDGTNRAMDHFLGFFAYGMDADRIVVEQYVFSQDFFSDIRSEHMTEDDSDVISVVHQFPFMIRIIHVQRFIELFKEYLKEFVQEKKILRIEDPILPENNGWYIFEREQNCIHVKKQRILTDCNHIERTVTMSVSELAFFIFKQMNKEDNKVFFAEII